MKCLYVSYDGLLDPLGQSQILPYLRRLRAAGHEFVILSFEKARNNGGVEALEHELHALGIGWHRLAFQGGASGFIQRLLSGARSIRKLVHQFQPDIVHLRGFVPALMNALSWQGSPHIYDFRSFALEEWVECGKISGRSLACQIFRRMDRRAVRTAVGVVVLEQPAADLLRRTYQLRPGVPLQVIRTSTDVSRFPRKAFAAVADEGQLRFVSLGGARFPYRPDLALRLVESMRTHGSQVSIDFVNEGDHEPLAEAVARAALPPGTVRIFAVKHADVPQLLGRYDCGVFFCETSPWRRVCSPTKLGEYLAAGLPVIALPGIDVIDHFAATTPCVTTVGAEEITRGIDAETARHLVAVVRTTGLADRCHELARLNFDLGPAGDRYVKLYEETWRFIAMKGAKASAW